MCIIIALFTTQEMLRPARWSSSDPVTHSSTLFISKHSVVGAGLYSHSLHLMSYKHSMPCVNITYLSFHLFFNVIFPHSSKSTIVVQYIWMGTDAGRVEIPHSQSLQTAGSWQGHVCLSIFKCSPQWYLDTVQSHTLWHAMKAQVKTEAEISSLVLV